MCVVPGQRNYLTPYLPGWIGQCLSMSEHRSLYLNLLRKVTGTTLPALSIPSSAHFWSAPAITSAIITHASTGLDRATQGRDIPTIAGTAYRTAQNIAHCETADFAERPELGTAAQRFVKRLCNRNRHRETM